MLRPLHPIYRGADRPELEPDPEPDTPAIVPPPLAIADPLTPAPPERPSPAPSPGAARRATHDGVPNERRVEPPHVVHESRHPQPVANFDDSPRSTPEVRVASPNEMATPPAVRSSAHVAPAAVVPPPAPATRPRRHTAERIVETAVPAERTTPTPRPTPAVVPEPPAWDATAEPAAAGPPPTVAPQRTPDALAPPRSVGRAPTAPAIPTTAEPVFDSTELPAATPAERHVHVTIGRLEVRVGGPPAKASKPAEPATGPTLAEYLRSRRGDGP